VVSGGAKQSITNTILCLINPGDEVLIPEPYWVSYPEMVKLAEGKSVFIPSTIDNDFKINPADLEKKITERSKVFLFSSPCNPSGTIYTKDELRAIAEVLAKKEDLYIISDEIYEQINFNGKHESIGQFDFIKDRVITVNGVSKGFAMTGWRIGYIGAPKSIAQACNTLQGQYTSGTSSISQMAALKALQSDPLAMDEVQDMKRAFLERRNMVLKRLENIKGIKANVPEGAFYIFPDMSSYYGKSNGKTTIKNGMDLCLYLLDKAQVALVPGSAFGSPEYIRISYAASMERLNTALDRIEKALYDLR